MVKRRSYEGDILSWEFVEFEQGDMKEFVEYTGASEERARMVFEIARKTGKKVGIERIQIKGIVAEGFCNISAILKQVHEDLQNILGRKALIKSRSIEKCDKCSNYNFSVEGGSNPSS